MTHISERERAAEAIQNLTRAIAPHQFNLVQGRPEFRINYGERSEQVRNLQVIANYLNGNDHIAVDGIYGTDTINAMKDIAYRFPMPGFNPQDGLSYTEIAALVDVASIRASAGQGVAVVEGTTNAVEELRKEAGNRIGEAGNRIGEAGSHLGRAWQALRGG